ncbi:tetratricopeptide repeat protein [Legionella drozanskii]|uniref:tetratricopeptide repeat protein n=1 Tax=Legionella drozanskii TaxID=96228 RepID=UPI001040E88A|nr:tetratricopeptide repeat protein [Legionella drozanskii]
MRVWWLLLLSVFACNSYAWSWADLWSTKDQQAQNLMKQGQYKQAETTFQHQDWRAAAAYRAGDYDQAAKQYQSLQNEQSYYNQGNALAHLGQYEKAIKAYNQAIALNPNNKDALFNRKLLEDFLKKNKNQQDQNQQDKNQQDQKQQDKNQQGENQQDKNQQDQNQQDKNQQGQNQQDKNQQGQNQQDKNQQGQNQQDKNQQGQNQQDKNQQGQNQQDKNQQGQDQQDKNQQGQDQQDKNQKGQDQQDKNQQTKAKQNKNAATGKDNTQSAEELEKQQAKDQWLKLIPDDPGGLMREKFLRDHLRREGGWYQ